MISRDCDVDITLKTYQWLRENDALESSNVTVVDPAKGLVRLDDVSLDALRSGTRVVALLTHCLARQNKKVTAPAPATAASAAVQRQHNWNTVDALFQDLTGFALPPTRKELLMCGDDGEIFALMRQVQQHVEGRVDVPEESPAKTAAVHHPQKRTSVASKVRVAAGASSVLPPVPSHKARVEQLRRASVAADAAASPPRHQVIVKSPTPATRAKTLPAFSPAGVPLVRDPPPTTALSLAHGPPTSHADTGVAVDDAALVEHHQRSVGVAVEVVKALPPSSSLLMSSPAPLHPSKSRPLNLAPFVGKVITMQTFIRVFWSKRLRHLRRQTLRYAIFTQCRFRYLYRLLPASRTLSNDADRFPLLRGQCQRCLPIIAVFRQVLIAYPNLSQERVAKFIRIACHRCRTLMNSMERWRPNEGEKIRLARERAARLTQAMLRIKTSVREKFERKLREEAFRWSNPRRVFVLVAWAYFRLKRITFRRRWVTIRRKAEMGEFKIGGPAFLVDGSCARCGAIQLALGERAMFCRIPAVVEKYTRLLCPSCKQRTAAKLKLLAALSMRKLRGAIRAVLFVTRAFKRAARLKGLSLRFVSVSDRRYQVPGSLALHFARITGGRSVCERCHLLVAALCVYVRSNAGRRSNFAQLADTLWCTACRSAIAVTNVPLAPPQAAAEPSRTHQSHQVAPVAIYHSCVKRFLAIRQQLAPFMRVFHFAFRAYFRFAGEAAIAVPALECQRCRPIKVALFERMFFVKRSPRPLVAYVDANAAPRLLSPTYAKSEVTRWSSQCFERFSGPKLHDVRRFFFAGAAEGLCAACAASTMRLLRPHFLHRNLNTLVRILVRWVIRVFFVFRKRKGIPPRFISARRSGDGSNVTSCPRCKPTIAALHERIDGLRGVRASLALVERYAAICCQRCRRGVLFRRDKPGVDPVLRLDAAMQANVAREVIAYRLLFKVGIARKLRTANVTAHIAWFRRFGFARHFDLSKTRCCERCGPIIDALEHRLHGHYFNGWAKSQQATTFHPASFFALMCPPCAAETRRIVLEQIMPRIKMAHRGVVRSRARIIRRILRRRIRPLAADECVRCAPITRALHQRFRGDPAPVSAAAISRYVAIMCVNCRDKEMTIATAKNKNRHYMMWVQARLRGKLLWSRVRAHQSSHTIASAFANHKLLATRQATFAADSSARHLLDMFLRRLAASTKSDPRFGYNRRLHSLSEFGENLLIAKYGPAFSRREQSTAVNVIMPFFVKLWRSALLVQARWRWRQRWRVLKQSRSSRYVNLVVSTKPLDCERCAPIVVDMQRRAMRMSESSRAARFKSVMAEEKWLATHYHKVLCSETCAPQAAKWAHLTVLWVRRARRVAARWRWWAAWNGHIKRGALGRPNAGCGRCAPIHNMLARRLRSAPNDGALRSHQRVMCAECQLDVGRRAQQLLADAKPPPPKRQQRRQREDNKEDVGVARLTYANLLVLISRVDTARAELRRLGEIGSPGDDVVAALQSARQQLVAAKRKIIEALDSVEAVEVTAAEMRDDVHAIDEGRGIHAFCESLVFESEAAEGNVELLSALLRQTALDVSLLLAQRGLASVAAGDGSVEMLRVLLATGQRCAYDFVDASTVAAFHSTERTALLAAVLDADAKGHLAVQLGQVVDSQLAPVFQEAFSSIASRAAAQPKENRDGRMRLLTAILGHRRFSRLVDIADEAGSDGQTILTRACFEGDLELLELLIGHLRATNAVNHVNKTLEVDGSTPLIQAVVGDHPNVVRFLVQQVPESRATWAVRSANGTAMELAVGLNRAEIVAELKKVM